MPKSILARLTNLAKISVLAATVTLAADGASAKDKPESSIEVITQTGTFVGTIEEGTIAHKGIPYARAPVAEFRWRLPQPLAVSSTSFDATQYKPHCPQENAPDDPDAEEDCLFLNVFAPKIGKPKGQLRPVMVWIHGGANAFGASDFYHPHNLVLNGDVIVVTLNYRLGALGFLAHPALRQENEGATNLGVADQQLALRWLQENIRAFGGDPDNVTLFGESAGALNILTHLASDASKALFHKAIIQSGGYLLETPPAEDAETRGISFAARLGCTAPDPVACMRDKSVAEVLSSQGTVNTDSAAYFQMTVDGHVLDETVLHRLFSGDFHKVPILSGSTRNEGNLFYSPDATPEDYEESVAEFSSQNHKQAAWTTAAYPFASYESSMEAASAVLGDAEFSCPALQIGNWVSNHVPTYIYEFSDPESLLNSAHFADIYYLFGFKDQRSFGIYGKAQSRKLAKRMQKLWASFARSGNPNSKKQVVWPRYRSNDPIILMLQTGELQAESAFAIDGFIERHNCHYWGIR